MDRFRLLRSCDAFVSLHRAEGFGLGMAEAMAQPQLAARGFWTEEQVGHLRLPVPAHPFVTSTDQPGHRGPAPEPGADNDTIWGALGRSPQELDRLRARDGAYFVNTSRGSSHCQ